MQQNKNTPRASKKEEGRAPLQLKRGGYSVALCAVALAIVIVVNLLAGKLPASFMKPDISEEGLYTLSLQTKELVRGLNEPVTIYLLAETGQEDMNTAALLERYPPLSSQLSVVYVDPVKNPYFYEAYSPTPLDLNSVIVTGGKRSKALASDGDVYVTNYTVNPQTYQPEPQTLFDGENAVTSAIDYVVSDVLPIVYNLTGHGEAELPASLKNGILKENIELLDLSLLTRDAVPEDADCILICSPTTDLSSSELGLLRDYMEGGGNLLLVTDYSQEEMPNLAALAEDFGLTRAPGLVFEQDANYCLYGYPQYVLPTIAEHALTAPLIENKYSVLMPIAQGIVSLPAYRGTLTITPLLTTSASSYSKLPEDGMTLDRAEDDPAGPFHLAALSSEVLVDGTANLIWFGSSTFLADAIDSLVSGANSDLFINALSWLCNKDTSISVHGKAFAPAAALVIPGSGTIIWAIVLIGVLPLSVLLCGTAVWLRRRRRV